MTDFSIDTTEKIISMIAGLIAIGGAIIWMVRKKITEDTPKTPDPKIDTSANQTTRPIATNPSTHQLPHPTPTTKKTVDISELKRTSHILFIDDDRGFKIVGVLKKMGWDNTKLVTDISSLEQPHLLSADVVFVDIQGVGRVMQHSDEGLGLALAIKRRYPFKKVVIYSAEEKGARFHEALQEADYSLPKTAEPIRFEDTIVRVLSK